MFELSAERAFRRGEQASNRMVPWKTMIILSLGIFKRRQDMTIRRDLNTVGLLRALPSLSIFVEYTREQSQGGYYLVRERR